MLLSQYWSTSLRKLIKDQNKDIYIKNTHNGQVSKTY